MRRFCIVPRGIISNECGVTRCYSIYLFMVESGKLCMKLIQIVSTLWFLDFDNNEVIKCLKVLIIIWYWVNLPSTVQHFIMSRTKTAALFSIAYLLQWDSTTCSACSLTAPIITLFFWRSVNPLCCSIRWLDCWWLIIAYM